MRDSQDIEYRNNHVMPEAWAERNGFKRWRLLSGSARPFDELVDRRAAGIAERLDTAHREADRILDHVRAFQLDGSRGVSAVVAAPYVSNIKRFLSLEDSRDIAHRVADSLGLYVRVGHPEDTIYLTPNVGDPTMPIVWWNPDRVQLPVPAIEDPYESFVD